ncbi:hypothetical protein DL762_006597 [Monosporascus cannonballus]|uniref:Uncharacterized protein n=1 Tax=Monosporascus cannonballus TaxID=155416 RepID=A0ABY0H5X7_9PEZI|nr:hypothetical protein DL762_006597 [Monosporascus cannonballus]
MTASAGSHRTHYDDNIEALDHDYHVFGLMYIQGFLQRNIYGSGMGCINADNNERTRASLEEAVLRVGSNWQEENVYGRYGDMPAIQIVSPDTPGVRYLPRRPEMNREDFEFPKVSPWPEVSEYSLQHEVSERNPRPS